MKFYVQYDGLGNITATIFSEIAPEFSNQLEFDDYTDTTDKQVNLSTLTLEDIPV